MYFRPYCHEDPRAYAKKVDKTTPSQAKSSRRRLWKKQAFGSDDSDSDEDYEVPASRPRGHLSRKAKYQELSPSHWESESSVAFSPVEFSEDERSGIILDELDLIPVLPVSTA